MTNWQWPGSTVTRVVDGDTLVAQVHRDLGFGGTVVLPIRLRLARINAPALSGDGGPEAKAYLTSLLPTDTAVDITTLKPYMYGGVDGEVGDWVGEIVLPDGRNVSDALVEAGHAVPWNGRGPKPGG